MTRRVAPVSLWPDPEALGTITDLYQLTMMAGYAAAGMDRHPATFELFVRRLPPARSYLVIAGLEQAIQDLLRLAFNPTQIELLRALPVFRHVDPGWFETLPSMRFQGDIWAVPEGSVVFSGEPLLRVEAPLAQAQWVETFLIASLAYPTMVASKAARIVHAANGKGLIDFGARRGHGPMSGMVCARASYLAGFDGTSQVEAALRLGIPCLGTMAHSWIQSFQDEQRAFEAFARVFPDHATMLVDTYDTLEGVRHAVRIDPPIQGVRLDSGDLLELSKGARTILDEAGRRDVQIVASGDLEEYKIEHMLSRGAPIDVFGVGTELITSRDSPSLGMVYKLVAMDGEGRMKLSPDKATYPMAKQVFRRRNAQGLFDSDLVGLADEDFDGEPLLVPYVRKGELVRDLPSLDEIRDHCLMEQAAIPASLNALRTDATYPVQYSQRLVQTADRLRYQVG